MTRTMILDDNEGHGISRAVLPSSSYPGGPTVSGAASVNSTHPLHSGEDVEEYRETEAVRSRRSRRSLRLRLGVAAVTAIGILGGAYSVMRARRTAEQLADAVRSEAATAHVTRETRRLINELWKMEELDVQRGPWAGRR